MCTRIVQGKDKTGVDMFTLYWTQVLLLTSLLCLILPAAAAGEGRETGKQPNILFILADDLGWNDVSYHGSEIMTPNIDKLAAAGVKLENYYVQPICSPTRTQLLSGTYQVRHAFL